MPPVDGIIIIRAQDFGKNVTLCLGRGVEVVSIKMENKTGTWKVAGLQKKSFFGKTEHKWLEESNISN